MGSEYLVCALSPSSTESLSNGYSALFSLPWSSIAMRTSPWPPKRYFAMGRISVGIIYFCTWCGASFRAYEPLLCRMLGIARGGTAGENTLVLERKIPLPPVGKYLLAKVFSPLTRTLAEGSQLAAGPRDKHVALRSPCPLSH